MRHITSFAAIVGDHFKPSYASIHAVFRSENLKKRPFLSRIYNFFTFQSIFFGFLFFGKSNRRGISRQLQQSLAQLFSLFRPSFFLCRNFAAPKFFPCLQIFSKILKMQFVFFFFFFLKIFGS